MTATITPITPTTATPTTTATELALPLLDLADASGTPADRAALLHRLRTAAHDLGFFYVTGHGIPQEVQDDLLAATRTFFALPEAARREISNLNSAQFRGWTSVATEHTAGAPDQREQIDIGPERDVVDLGPDDPAYLRLVGPNQWPTAVPELRAVVLRWLREAERVARTVLGLLAEALGQDAGWFDRWFDDESVTTTKLVHYPAPPVGVGRRRHEQPGRRGAQGLRMARAGAAGRPVGPAGACRGRQLARGHPGARDAGLQRR